jgi:hypothetical protein
LHSLNVINALIFKIPIIIIIVSQYKKFIIVDHLGSILQITIITNNSVIDLMCVNKKGKSIFLKKIPLSNTWSEC